MIALDIIRYTVVGLFTLGAAAAVGSWAITTRRINPFSPLAKLIRTTTDPVLEPIERWRLRRGGNPQNAPWWFLAMLTGAGIVIIAGSQWVVLTALRAGGAVQSGPRAVLKLIIYYAGQIVILALIARVIGSWIGWERYNKWMRIPYALTDWIVNPLRRIVPRFGPFDVTPVVAWLLLQIVILPVLIGLL